MGVQPKLTTGNSPVAAIECRTAAQEFRADWPLVLTAMMGAGLSAILAYAIGVLLNPIRQEFGWSSEIVLFGLTLSGILSALGAPFSGRLMKRFGARRLALAGTIVLVSATLALSSIRNSIPAYLGCFVLVAAGHTMLSAIIWQAVIVARFVTARGLAVSIVLCGSNMAGAVAPLLATLAMDRAGWRGAVVALAAYMLVSSLPLTWFFLREAKRPAAGPSSTGAARPPLGKSAAEARTTREFWLMCASFVFAGIGMGGYTVHLVPMLTSQGISLLLAASAVSSLSLAALVGRLLTGVLMDHLFAPRLAAAALALPLIGSLILISNPAAYWAAISAAVLVGFASGAEYNMIAYLTARYFGLRDFGTIGGILFSLFTIGCLGGQQLPVLLLRLGDYDYVIVLFAVSFLAAALMMLLCRGYPELQPDIRLDEQEKAR